MIRDSKTVEAHREKLKAGVSSRDIACVTRAARDLLEDDDTIRNWHFIAASCKELRAPVRELTPVKVALLSSFSIEFVHDALISRGVADGIQIEIYQAGFNQYQQEILHPQSGLYQFAPDVVVLAIEGRQLAPGLYEQFMDRTDEEHESELVHSVESIRDAVNTMGNRLNAHILIHNLSRPRYADLGIGDGNTRTSQIDLINKLNAQLQAVARETTGVYVVDYDSLVGRVGSHAWYDLRMAHFAGAPISQKHIGLLAGEYVRFIRAFTGKNKKCLVLDLDNTLWGGLAGEAGHSGIRLGPQYPGSAYLAFQKEILKLHKQGVILAIASKNNEADANDVFANNEYMVLSQEHFSSTRVNWNPKSQSIVEIASELNIGLEHIVFVDDSAAECALVSESLPAVTTIHLSTAPEQYIDLIRRDGLFDALNITSEDTERGRLYAQRRQAEQFKDACENLEQFYANLAMQLEIKPIDNDSVGRAVQLTQKTNQFNATTIRMTEAEVLARCDDPRWLLLTVRVKDRFGDNGIVGLVMARCDDNSLDIDTFILSCRIIGRTIETALLSVLYDTARHRRLEYLAGRIVATKKNAPVRDLFEKHGFERKEATNHEETFWQLKMSDRAIQMPEWFELMGKVNSE